MGSDRAKLSTRCCYAAVCIVVLSAMFWIAWCVFSVAAVPVSESQRRAIVHYSPTPSTPAEETSAFNAISKLPTTSSLGQKDKGDFAPREVNTGDSKPDRNPAPKGGAPIVEVQTRRVLSTAVENRPEKKLETDADGSPPTGTFSDSRSDIRPSVIQAETKSEVVQSSRQAEDEPTVRVPEFEKGETRRRVVTPQADRGRQEEDERGSKDKYGGADRGRESDERYSKGDTRVYPDVTDDARSGSAGKEDRVRKGDEDEDDRYRYREPRPRPADDQSYRSRKEERDRYRDEERYRDRDGDKGRARDDDRYRDRDDDKYRDRDADRYRDRDDDKYRDRDVDKIRDRDVDRYRDRDDDKIRDRDVDRYRDRDGDRYRDRVDDRYRDRDGYRYRDRDGDRYRDRDDDKYIDRDDDKYRDRDDDKYRDRDDDRYRDRDGYRYRDRDGDRYRDRDDDRYKSRDDDRYRDRKEDRPKYRDEVRPLTGDDESYTLRKDDDKYGYRGSEKYGPRDEDEEGEKRYLPREDDRRRSSEEKGYRTREDDDKYLSPSVSASSKSDNVGERKPTTSSRYEYRSGETVTDYDIPVRAREERPPRPAYDEDRKRGWDDEDRRPYTRDKDRLEISPTRTRTREDSSVSGPFRSRSSDDEDRKYSSRSRIRDDERTVVQGSRRSYSADDASRRYTDERESHRPVESTRLSDREDDVLLDRRSYISDDEYRKSSRRYDDRDRRRYEDDDSYSRRDRVDEDDEYRRDRDKRRDRYDDDDDRRYDRRPPPRYRDEDELPVRDPDRSVKIEGSRRVEESPRRRDEDRSYGRDDYRPSRPYDDRDSSERPRRPAATKEPSLGSSTVSRNPDESVAREKRYPEENTRRSPVRPLSAKDVIEAANRQSDTSESNARKVFYPVFDPRQSNLTSPEVIQPGERRGTTITLRKRRYA